MLDKIFKLSDNKTSVKTELVAGITTFMTMAYIIALNPNLLTNFGFGVNGSEDLSALWNGVFLATCHWYVLHGIQRQQTVCTGPRYGFE